MGFLPKKLVVIEITNEIIEYLEAFVGAPERIRTSDLCLRRATLYPAELRVLTRHGLACIV